MSENEVLIRGGHVVTVDPGLGALPGADVLVDGGRIKAVGRDLTPSRPGARVIDARGRLVLPGLVDTHRHAWLGAAGASAPGVSLLGYSAAVMGEFAARYGPDDVYAGVLWGALQALNAGVTTIADWAHNLTSPAHADADIRALRDSGIRGVFLYGGPGEPERTSGVSPVFAREARRLREEFFGGGADDRLSMGLALRGPLISSPAANEADFGLARELGLPVSVHAGMAGFGGAVSELDRLGLLGPDVNFAHANEFTPAEYELIAASGSTIAISPSVDMTMALGTYPATGQALAYGITAGLAADTVASGGTDLFSEMRLALAAERSRANAGAVARGEAVSKVDLDHEDLLRLATIGGARVWGLGEDVGSLTPGKRADIAVVDLRPPHLDGFGDPVYSMLLGAGPSDVEAVLVGGEVVKEHGRLVGPVAERARELMRASRDRLGWIAR